ncbi:hypothetical protein EIP91_004178 [Steccherinum ochraceum]|uniref:Uncharacterized protein n=1 Tax=Steccherinum ochraceum TaxID=92696 RepID=A0A4V6N7A2_9APHY|nr:hypothetical protein EIP91_004178 [Steccherinum ochraceum]
MAVDLPVSDDHPLALELTSLRTAVSRYQHEAHTASVKLQRHSLDTTHALEGARLLEQENQRLSQEVAILRANPDITPHPAAIQVPELTLALRKLSDKLTLTEEAVASQTAKTLASQNALAQAQWERDNARVLAAEARAREAEGHVWERELMLKAKTADEERKMADLVVQEYADLVRSLEGRARAPRSSIQMTREASSSSVTLVESLAEGKSGLHKLLEEFNGESARHATDFYELQGKLDEANASLASERKNVENLQSQLASALIEVNKAKMDDNTAAKMVSRYMKFSQSTTDSLQKAMDNLKVRHAATTATLEKEADSLRKALLFERRQSETLRRALDELSEDISREAYGRRREIGLRLAFLGREESLAESLRRWTRKSRESFHRVLSKQPQPTDNSPLTKVFERVIDDAERLLGTLNGEPASEDEVAEGSVARVLAAQNAAAALTRELHQETSRRLEAERRLAHYEASEGDPSLEGVPPSTVLSGAVDETAVLSNGAPQLRDPPKRDVSLMTSPLPLKPPPESPLTEEPIAHAPSTELEPAFEAVMPPSAAKSEIPSAIPPHSLDIYQIQPSLGQLLPTSSEPHSTIPTEGLPVQDTSLTPAVPTITEPESNGLQALDEHSNVRDVPTAGTPATQELASPLPEIVVAAISTSTVQPSPVEDAARPIVVAEVAPTPTSLDLTIEGATASPVYSPQPVPSPSNIPLPHSAISDIPSSLSPALTLTSISPTPQREPSPAPDHDSQQRLLAELRSTQHRYDALQRSFRDCDIALKDLKSDVVDLPESLDMTLVVRAAVDRLKDYNEDARVELEIRISDEERIYTGYVALLSIPGAISDEVDAAELEDEIQAFVSGTDKGVAKAMQQLTRKLDDLQHDIAAVKLSAHELASSAEEQPEAVSAGTQSGWSAWTGGLLSPSSRPSSPAPATFGSVMTSPRLRHSASLSRMNSQQRSPTDPDMPPLSSPSPFTSLGLRIPMPAHVTPPPPLSRRQSSSLGLGLGGPSGGRPGPRPRVSSASAMYLLGLGARSGSFSTGQSPPVSQIPKLPMGSPIGRRMSVKEEVGSESGSVVESDVE